MSIQIEVWGDYACFTRPEMKSERVSYDVMTPSAARGLVEAIYWHPEIQYKIDKIYVMNPIRFTSVRRNEVKSTISGDSILASVKGSGRDLGIYTQSDREQRSALLLRDVRYVIEAHFETALENNSGKYQAILRRRLSRGQCYSQPYFGCREFTAQFREWPGGKIPTVDLNQELGYMLYDMDYSDPSDIRANFFRAQLEHGILDCREKVTYT